jgi:hypothetical protein
MAESIADLSIQLRATADKLSSDINSGLRGAQQSTSVGAVALGTAIGVSVVAGLGAAMAGVKKVVGLAFEGLDRIDALDEAASKIGIAYNALQDLKFAAEMTGGSLEGMVSALAKMQANLASGSADEALLKLGLSAQNLRDLAPEKQFAEIAQKLSEIQNTGDKIDLTKSFFGKGGVEILNVINMGKEGIESMSAATEKLGGHLTDAQRSMATMAQENIEKLQTGWGFIKDQLAVAIAPVLIDMVNTVKELADESNAVGEIIRNWPIYFVETVATAAEAVQAVSQFARVWKDWNEAAKDNPFTLNPLTDYKNSMEDLDAALMKHVSLEKNAGDVVRERYEKQRLASQAARLEALNAAREKKELDKDVADGYVDTTKEMTRAYEAQMAANRAANGDFSQSFDAIWKVMPEKVQASLDQVVEQYTATTKGLKELTVEWVSMMISNFLAVSNLMNNVQYVNASDWWKKTNDMLQSLGSRKDEGVGADAQATLDSMKTSSPAAGQGDAGLSPKEVLLNKQSKIDSDKWFKEFKAGDLSPSQAAMARSAAAQEASQAREAARIDYNRTLSQNKSAERYNARNLRDIRGGMKIGSFDGSFTAPSMNGQAPSFFGGGGMKTPRMNTAAAGGTLGAVTINQSFSSGVTRAELAGSMDDLKDATLGAVLNAVSNGGGFRNALQA